MSLTIMRRLGLLVLLAAVVSVALVAFQLLTLRDSLFVERRLAITAQVEAAASIVKGFAAQATSGKITEAEAQERAKTALRSVRFGSGEYIIVYDTAGVLQVHRLPELEGKLRIDTKDANGVPITREIIAAAQRGGGYVSYVYPREGNPQPSPKMSYVLPYAPWGWSIAAGVYIDDIDTTFWREVRNSTSVSIAGLAILLAAAWYLARGLVRPLRQLTTAMETLAAGTLDVEVPGQERSDDIAPMAKAVQIFKNNAVALQASEASSTETRHRAEADREANAASQEQHAAAQAHVVEAVGSALRQLSAGDLAFRLSAPFEPEYESLRTDFNEAMDGLQSAMQGVVSAAGTIQSGTGEIASAADDLSRRTEQQAASLEETAAALDEITATVRKTAEGATHARDVVSTAREGAERSGEVVRNAVTAMSAIEKSSSEIGQIIGVIDEIAFQTNLLALNAGVEAARAGEAGRGFAVVAQEVRALAQRSAEAAKEIKALISASGTQVASGVALVGETGRALAQIVTQVTEINAIVAEIAASAAEQSTGLAEVNTAVNQMDQVTQQNAAMVEQTTAASHSLGSEAEQLAALVGRFRLGAGSETGSRREAGSRATPMRKKSAPLPVRSAPRAAAQPVTRGNLALKAAPAEQSWEEF